MENRTWKPKNKQQMTTSQPVKILFDPHLYLNKYFTGKPKEINTKLIKLYADLYGQLQGQSLLEFGGGPTIYTLINAVQAVDWIHFTDYNLACVKEIEKWINNDIKAFNWQHYIYYALQCEKENYTPTHADVVARATTLRQKISVVSQCDAWETDPLLGNGCVPYSIVAVNFCLEALTGDKKNWLSLNKKISNLVEKNGYYILTSLWNTSTYLHNKQTYPCTHLNVDDIKNMYTSLGFKLISLETLKFGQGYYEGYIMGCGQRIA